MQACSALVPWVFGEWHFAGEAQIPYSAYGQVSVGQLFVSEFDY